MSKGKILVVDPDEDIRNMLNMYFTGQGYEVVCVADGESALEIMQQQPLPDLLILTVELPFMNGYDVCRVLRTTTRTAHIPIIYLSQQEIDKNPSLLREGWSFDDYVTKPFDIEELKLRTRSLMESMKRLNTVDSVSKRPKARLLEDHLRDLRQLTTKWVYLNIVIQNFEAFSEVYGWQAGDEVIRAMSLMLGDIVGGTGTQDDFIGHLQRDNFVVITHTDDTATFKQSLIDHFNTEIQQHYSFLDRERGYIKDGDKRLPLMLLAITEIPHTYFGEQWDGTLPKQGG